MANDEGKTARRSQGDEPAVEPERAARDAQREAAREVEADEPTFPRERLLGPDAFVLTGYEGHVLAGALDGVTKKNLTISEAKAAAEAWLSAEVKEA